MDVARHGFDWGDNFVNNYPKCTFSEFAQALYKQYHKVQIDKQIYMSL
jgi:hypothetical protein